MPPAGWKPMRDLLVVLVEPPRRINYRSPTRLMLCQMTGECGLNDRQLYKKWSEAHLGCRVPTGSYFFGEEWAKWFGMKAMPTLLYLAHERWRDPIPTALITPDRRWHSERTRRVGSLHEPISVPTKEEWAALVLERLNAFPYTLALFVDAVI